MRRAALMIAAAAGLVLATACATVSVRTDWDAEASFGSYSSFALTERPQRGRARVSPLVARRIERELVATLTATGLRVSGRGGADLLVTYHTAVRERLVVSHAGYAYPRRWRWGWGTTTVRRYREGTLVVDLVDRRRRELVWRGVAEGAFGSPSPSDEKVRKVVTRILATFPPE